MFGEVYKKKIFIKITYAYLFLTSDYRRYDLTCCESVFTY